MTIDTEIFGDYTEIIAAGTMKLVYFAHIGTESILSVALLNIASTIDIQSAIEKREYVLNNLITDILWEDIKIDGTPVATITSDILSQTFSTPSVLKLDNTSAFDVRVSIRCNS